MTNVKKTNICCAMVKRFMRLFYIILLFPAVIAQGDCLSDFVDEPFYQLCTICEKALINSGRNINELNNDIVYVFGKRNFLRSYIYHNDRDFKDCCEIFYFVKNYKDTFLSKEEQHYMILALSIALLYFCQEKDYFCKVFTLSQDDANFVKTINLENYYKRCRLLKIPTEEASNTPSKTEENTSIPNTKIDSCALL